MKRTLKNAVKQLWVRLFALGQKFGVDILPRHFYSEIPDMAKLKATDNWKKPYNMVSLSADNLQQ